MQLGTFDCYDGYVLLYERSNFFINKERFYDLFSVKCNFLFRS